MCENILEPVSSEDYNYYLDNFFTNNYCPVIYNRLKFSVSVISDFLKNGSSSFYTRDDAIYEMYSVYRKICNNKNVEFDNFYYSIIKIVSYAYSKLKLGKYRKGKAQVKSNFQFLAILKKAKTSIVNKNYRTKYVVLKA